jgi:hypothetical protein
MTREFLISIGLIKISECYIQILKIASYGYTYTTALKAKLDLISLTNIHSAPVKTRLCDLEIL